MNNTFIIVTWNNAQQISRLIDSILKFEKDSKVIVVDNDSSDGTVGILKKYNNSRVKLIPLIENVGFARANNIAFQQVKTDYVTFINPDTQLTASIIESLESKLKGRIGMIGIRLKNIDGSLQPSIYRFQIPSEIIIEQFGIGKVLPESLRKKYSPENSRHNQKAYVDWIIGAFMFTKASYYQQVGGFSEDYFLYSEDMDLCYKYHQNGYQILFDPTKSVMHVGGSSEKQTSEGKNIKLLRSFCTFARKFGLTSNIKTLYFSYLIKKKLFALIDKKRASRYQENVEFLKKQMESYK